MVRRSDAYIEEEGAAAKAGGIFSACSREREACVSPGAELSGERRPRERCWRRGAMEWAWVFAGEEELAASHRGPEVGG